MTSTTYLKKFSGHSKALTSLIEKDGQLRVRKEIQTTSREDILVLEKQCTWLMKVPTHSRKYFPYVIEYHKSKHYFSYDMSFFDLPSLSDLWFSGLISTQEVEKILKNMLHTYIHDLYLSQSFTTQSDYVRETLIQRTFERIQQAEALSAQFKHFNRQKEYIFNGERIRNAQTLLEIIKKQQARYQPETMGIAHGDLSFANILTDGDQIIFIDPRGDMHNTLLYDLAKLYTSFVELWEIMKEREITIHLKKNSIQSNFHLPTHLEHDAKKFENILWDIYAEIPFITKEQNWKTKIILYAGIQLIANCTFTLHRRGISYTKLTYATGLKLLERAVAHSL